MSANTRITLPLHLRSAHLAKVLAKLMQVPCARVGATKNRWRVDDTGQGGFQPEKQPFDGDQPSSEANHWSVEFQEGTFPHFVAHSWESPLVMVDLMFTNPAGGVHNWPFFSESETEQGKVLLPDCDALALAAGQRLVDFFGGEVQAVTNDPQPYRVDPQEALYGPRVAGQTDDDRWHQFQNALHALPALRLEDLNAAAKRFAPDEIAAGLMKFLAAQDVETTLDAVLPQPLEACTKRSAPRM